MTVNDVHHDVHGECVCDADSNKEGMMTKDGVQHKTIVLADVDNGALVDSHIQHYCNCKIKRALQKVEEFYPQHNETIQASHGIQHVLQVYHHSVKAIACHLPPLPARVGMEIQIAALLHDVDDAKYFSHHADFENARSILRAIQLDDDDDEARRSCANILEMIGLVSCSKNGNTVPQSIIQTGAYYRLIPRWADRLEAVGAIGVLRCYLYNAEHELPLSSEHSPRATTEAQVWQYATADRFHAYLTSGGNSDDMISHYYDKLLHIARPPKDIVCNSYLEHEAQESSKELVEMCIRFGRSGTVDEDFVRAVARKLGIFI